MALPSFCYPIPALWFPAMNGVMADGNEEQVKRIA